MINNTHIYQQQQRIKFLLSVVIFFSLLGCCCCFEEEAEFYTCGMSCKTFKDCPQTGNFNCTWCDDGVCNPYPYTTWVPLSFPDNPGPPGRVYSAYNTGAPVPPPYDPTTRTGFVIFGGALNASTWFPLLNDLWVMNAVDNHQDGRAWTELQYDLMSGDVPSARCLSAIAVEPTSGNLYLFGGFNSTHWFNDTIHYPGSTGTWTLLNPDSSESGNTRPSPRCGMSASFLNIFNSDTIFLVIYGGGFNFRQLYDEVWTYAPASSNWTLLPVSNPYSKPSPREIPYLSGQMYVAGGYEYGYGFLDDVWFLELLVGRKGNVFAQWEEGYSMKVLPPVGGRADFAWSGVSTYWMTYGGRGGENGTEIFGDCWIKEDEGYSGSKWSPIDVPSALGARFGMASGTIINSFGEGAFVVFGGSTDLVSGTILNDTWMFAIASP